MRNKYSPELIKKANLMKKQGCSIKFIMVQLGFKERSIVLYHTSEKRRKNQDKFTRRWMKNNPEKVKKICRKASKKYYNSPYGRLKSKERSKISWQKIKNDQKKHKEYNERQRIIKKKRRDLLKLNS